MLGVLLFPVYENKRPLYRNSTSGFRFSDVVQLQKSKSICIPNFDNIAQSAAEILLFPGTKGRHIEILLPVPFWCLRRHRHVILRRFENFYPNWMIGDKVMTSYESSKMATTASQIYNFRFPLWWRIPIRNFKAICTRNFAKITQPAAEIILLPLSENKRPPYWNCTSVFPFDMSFGMWFYIGVLNFIQIVLSAADRVMTS